MHGCAFLRFLGRLLDPSSMGWPTLLRIAIIHCDNAVFLPNHELHLSEEHSNFGTYRVATVGNILEPLLRETVWKPGRPTVEWASATGDSWNTLHQLSWPALPVWHGVPGVFDQKLYLSCLHAWLDGLYRYSCKTMFRPLEVATRFYTWEKLKKSALSGARESTCKIQRLPTQHVHEIFQDRQRIVAFHDSDEQANMDDIVFAFKLFRNWLVYIQSLERYIRW